MKRIGELSYYESKLKLLNTPNLDPNLVKLGCWDAPFESTGLSNQRKCQSFIRQCKKYYEKKIHRIQKEQSSTRRGKLFGRLGF
jgi:hypothetical protein